MSFLRLDPYIKMPIRNDPTMIANRAFCLHEWFQRQVDQTPLATAVVAAERSLSYQQLNREANRLAREMIARGIGPGQRVGLCLQRTPDLLIGILGTLKAGASYAPIDPAIPASRFEFILNDCEAKLVVSSQELADRFNLPASTLLRIADDGMFGTSAADDQNPLTGVRPSDLAYVIYTSGSTGTPKGVMVTHQNVVRLFTSTAPWFNFGPQDTWTLFHSYAFDFSVWEIWGALLYGGKLVVVPYATSRSPRDFYRLLAEHEVTILNQTPSAFRQLILADEELHRSHPLSLRKVIFGGEALEFSSLRPWIGRHGDTAPALINMYGITETTVHVTYRSLTTDDIANQTSSCVGVPIPDLQVHVLDEDRQQVPVGTIGEIYVGGSGVASGYLNRPELTAERFLSDPFAVDPSARLYRTGDLGRIRENGELEYHGRLDRQVQLRGFRIELGEIEACLQEHHAVGQAIALVTDGDENVSSSQRLIAYVVPSKDQSLEPSELRQHLSARLPEYMLPQLIVPIETIPLTVNGKLDASALPSPQAAEVEADYLPPFSSAEQIIADVWKDLLGLDRVTCNASFFELGGQSLMLPEMERRLRGKFPRPFAVVDVFQHRTIADLARFLTSEHDQRQVRLRSLDHGNRSQQRTDAIAIVGMAGRFPGAGSVAEFWHNVNNGVESICRFTPEELIAAGVSPALSDDPRFVPAAASLDDITSFDAEFFSFSPHEARITDPQHRLFLECAWTALEDAGYYFPDTNRRIGVFAGARPNSYRELVHRWLDVSQPNVAFETLLSNEKDFLATRVAHRLDLHGPAMTVQTGCSTSLVAVQLACQALASGQCSMALAGAVSVYLENHYGYLSEEGMIVSPDGHVRAFDADAQGTVFGEGVAVVVLKRLADAVENNDSIYAVIKAVAVNNDGAAKTGFAAPSVDGQAEVIQMALAQSGVSADQIGYVETHGTGTYIGDPVEIAALNQAFGDKSDRRHSCAIGSVKTNIGHLDVAAGMAGLIKAALVVREGVIPPSLNFDRPSPLIDFQNSSFFVNTRSMNWKSSVPRRAGVSAFGVGGTNAHAILEQPPQQVAESSRRKFHLIPISARSDHALNQRQHDLGQFLSEHRDTPLADLAFSCQHRRSFRHRQFFVAETLDQLDSLLQETTVSSAIGSAPIASGSHAPVVFIFPGQGAQHLNMAKDLYDSEPVFRKHLDHCCELLVESLGFDLRHRLFAKEPSHQAAAALNQTSTAQPAIFSVSYALARWLESLGVVPSRMIGHSIGEFVAATLAGVFSLEQALRLIALRAQKMQCLPPGSMLAVRLAASELTTHLPPDISLAAINSPNLCVVSGAATPLKRLREKLEQDDVVCRQLHTSHAFHSLMMQPAIEPLIEHLRSTSLGRPAIPIVSSLTGLTLTDEQATSPHYWANQLRETVRFSDALVESVQLSGPQAVFLEVGPGQTLSTLARQHTQLAASCVQSLLPHAQQSISSAAHALTSIGRLWQVGVELEWNQLYSGETRRHLDLPTYPFERQRYWADQLEPSITNPQPDRPLQPAIPVLDSDPNVAQHDALSMPNGKHSQMSKAPDRSLAQRIIAQQLEIMREQLESIRG